MPRPDLDNYVLAVFSKDEASALLAYLQPGAPLIGEELSACCTAALMHALGRVPDFAVEEVPPPPKTDTERPGHSDFKGSSAHTSAEEDASWPKAKKNKDH